MYIYYLINGVLDISNYLLAVKIIIDPVVSNNIWTWRPKICSKRLKRSLFEFSTYVKLELRMLLLTTLVI